jgi:hypothetical protein
MNEEPLEQTPHVDKEAPDSCPPTKAPVTEPDPSATETEPIHAPLTEDIDAGRCGLEVDVDGEESAGGHHVTLTQNALIRDVFLISDTASPKRL